MKELKLLEHPVRNESKHSLMAYFLLYFPKKYFGNWKMHVHS